MFRKATFDDIDDIARIYEDIHTEEENGRMTIGWIRNVYPTRHTAEQAVASGDMFVEVIEGKIVASARINSEEVPEYINAAWKYNAPAEKISVLHTLCVDPKITGKGYGAAFVDFYELYSKEKGCPYLRMDTNQKNVKARKLYAVLGYEEIGIVDCIFNGIPDVKLVCLEKKI